MKNRKKIQDLFEQIDAAFDAVATAEEKLKANNGIIRSFFGLSTASEKELSDAIDQQRSFGEPIEFIEDAVGAKTNATTAMRQAEAKCERLLAEAAKLVDAEAGPLVEALTGQLRELEEKITKAMSPYFDDGVIKSAMFNSHLHAALSHRRSSIQAHTALMPRWKAVQRIDMELNEKEK